MSNDEEVTLKSMMESIVSMKQSFDKSIESVNTRVDMLAQRQSRTPSPRQKEPERSVYMPVEVEPESSRKRTRGAEPRCAWADRCDTVNDLPKITDADFEDKDLLHITACTLDAM